MPEPESPTTATRHVEQSGPPYDWWAVENPLGGRVLAGGPPVNGLVVHDVPAEPGAEAYAVVGRAGTVDAAFLRADAVLFDGDLLEVVPGNDGIVALQHPMAGVRHRLHFGAETPDGPVLLDRCERIDPRWLLLADATDADADREAGQWRFYGPGVAVAAAAVGLATAAGVLLFGSHPAAVLGVPVIVAAAVTLATYKLWRPSSRAPTDCDPAEAPDRR